MASSSSRTAVQRIEDVITQWQTHSPNSPLEYLDLALPIPRFKNPEHPSEKELLLLIKYNLDATYDKQSMFYRLCLRHFYKLEETLHTQALAIKNLQNQQQLDPVKLAEQIHQTQQLKKAEQDLDTLSKLSNR
ncbi:ORF 1 [Bougainvillea chlorotic vein banding virus]|uniref:ORF 1 n=1 Tax=Bougainvillea chlorotic vein banding virus TaxID=263892 RepID=A7LLW5_9VIRU|nr:ORF 1 [Bougainvillea chlorotic vein banding virus]ABS76281.1 ORF 1 [Bougainvillea chlorotic vein banding virus]